MEAHLHLFHGKTAGLHCLEENDMMEAAEQPNIHGAKPMGWYYDWLEKKWQPKQQPSSRQRQHHSRRQELLRDLLGEINTGDSITKLYAGLLARAVVSQDEELCRTDLQSLRARMTQNGPALVVGP